MPRGHDRLKLRSPSARPRLSSLTLRCALAVCAALAGELQAAPPARNVSYSSGHPEIDALEPLVAATLAANEKQLDGHTGHVQGFGAGDAYPQIWLRDSATLLPVTRYYYPRERLTSWIEEHFSHQREDGSLYDWVAAGPPDRFALWAPRARAIYQSGSQVLSADKNTIEADQESSAVLAVAEAFRITGDILWLSRPVAGVPLLERCDRALEYLLTQRFHAGLGLVTSGFAADWGDISPVYPDQRAIYLDAATPLVAGLYTNALAFEAVQSLARMCAARLSPGDAERARRLRGQAARLQESINVQLWQDGQGHYLMHRPLRGGSALADDGHIFAMGGHAVALLAGVVPAPRASRVIAVAESRRLRWGASTISASLLPPFATGFFKHPAVAEAWSYQNGGQWDWFGARFVLAEFQQGCSDLARTHLRELAAKARQGGLYEWHTRDGLGRGSPRYAGSAAALGRAVIEGYFGVSLDAPRLVLRPRASGGSARLRLRERATGMSVDYVFSASESGITLEYRSTHRLPGLVSIALPAGRQVGGVTLDGRKFPHRLARVGAERYVEIETDWSPHRLQVLMTRTAKPEEDAAALVSCARRSRPCG